MVLTDDGCIVVTGGTTSLDMDFEGTNRDLRRADSTDVFVMKIDPTGKVLWKNVVGGSGRETGFSIASTTDGGYVITGGSSSNDGDFKGMSKGNVDVFVLKTSSLGDVEWLKTFGGAKWETGYAVVSRPDGTIIVTGISYPEPEGDFKEGYNWRHQTDVVTILLDAQGNLQRTTQLVGFEHDGARSAKAALDGGLVIVGTTLSPEGVFQRNRWPAGSNSDMFILKFDPSGKVSWSQAFGGSGFESGDDVIIASDNTYVLLGSFPPGPIGDGHADFSMIKVDASGQYMWTRKFGGIRPDYVYYGCEAADKGLFVVGTTESNDRDFAGLARGMEDVFVMKTDSNGNKQWIRTFGGSNAEVPFMVLPTPDGGCYVTGRFVSNDGTFKGLLKSSSIYDMFIMKLTASGEIDTVPNLVYVSNERHDHVRPVFPNPVVAQASLNYTLHDASHTTIELFNSLGQLLSTLRDEYQESGKHILLFDRDDLSSGFYFLKVTTERASHVQILVVQ
jgi:hypothetical protein